MDNDTPSIWELLENPDEGTQAVAELINWTTNFNWANQEILSRPYDVFLDLIGQSEELYGTTFGKGRELDLDFVSLDKLADALKEYADRPQKVINYLKKIAQSEQRD